MSPNFIEIYDNALSSKECREIISYINDQSLTQGNTSSGILKEVKDCWETWGSVGDESMPSQYVAVALNKYLPLYRKSYPAVDNILCYWSIVSRYNLQKYHPGQAYHALHCENDCSLTSSRTLAWMFYLNDVTEGGGTYFESYDKTLNAVEGRLVIWPAYWTHGHKGVMSKTQSKYIMTGWCEYIRI